MFGLRRDRSRTMTNLRDVRFDPEFTPGAQNAVGVCLRIAPAEQVTLITDMACLEIAASIARELDRLGAPYRSFVLEDLASRPMKTMPDAVLESLESSQVSIYAVFPQAGE